MKAVVPCSNSDILKHIARRIMKYLISAASYNIVPGPQEVLILIDILFSVFLDERKELSTIHWPYMATTGSLSSCAGFLVVAEKSIEKKQGCLAGFRSEVPLSRLQTPSETQNDIETNHNRVFFSPTRTVHMPFTVWQWLEHIQSLTGLLPFRLWC